MGRGLKEKIMYYEWGVKMVGVNMIVGCDVIQIYAEVSGGKYGRNKW